MIAKHVCFCFIAVGQNENGIIKAENGTSPRLKKIKAP